MALSGSQITSNRPGGAGRAYLGFVAKEESADICDVIWSNVAANTPSYSDVSTNTPIYAVISPTCTTTNVEAAASLTPWDVANATYDSKSFDASGSDGDMFDMDISPAGDELYMLGNSSDKIYQFPLTDGDLSTVIGASVTSYPFTEDSNPRGFAFNAARTKLYMLGATNKKVYQYSITSGDVTTLSYDSIEYDISIGSTENNPWGIALNSDDTKMYITGSGTKKAYQHSMTAGDLSTAAYTTKSANLSGESNDPYDIFIKPDDTKFYTADLSGLIHQYSFIDGDLDTAAYDTVLFDTTNETGWAESVYFNSTGTKMYVIDGDLDTAHQYTTEI